MKKFSIVMYALATICSAAECVIAHCLELGAVSYLFFWFTVILIVGAVADWYQAKHVSKSQE